MAKTALMQRVNDVPEFSVHFHVRIVEIVAERRLIIVIIIVDTKRRFWRIFGEASIGIGAIVVYS